MVCAGCGLQTVSVDRLRLGAHGRSLAGFAMLSRALAPECASRSKVRSTRLLSFVMRRQDSCHALHCPPTDAGRRCAARPAAQRHIIRAVTWQQESLLCPRRNEVSFQCPCVQYVPGSPDHATERMCKNVTLGSPDGRAIYSSLTYLESLPSCFPAAIGNASKAFASAAAFCAIILAATSASPGRHTQTAHPRGEKS